MPNLSLLFLAVLLAVAAVALPSWLASLSLDGAERMSAPLLCIPSLPLVAVWLLTEHSSEPLDGLKFYMPNEIIPRIYIFEGFNFCG